MEEDLEMSKQSRAAMNNKRWKPQSDAWLQDRYMHIYKIAYQKQFFYVILYSIVFSFL